MPKVKDIMSSDVVTISSSARLAEAARLMRDNDVGMLPVMDGNNLQGVITDRDIVVKGLAGQGESALVGSIASPGITSVKPGDDAKEIQMKMSDSGVRRLPVVDNGRLVGIVSVGDLAVREDDQTAGKVMQETGPAH